MVSVPPVGWLSVTGDESIEGVLSINLTDLTDWWVEVVIVQILTEPQCFNLDCLHHIIIYEAIWRPYGQQVQQVGNGNAAELEGT